MDSKWPESPGNPSGCHFQVKHVKLWEGMSIVLGLFMGQWTDFSSFTNWNQLIRSFFGLFRINQQNLWGVIDLSKKTILFHLIFFRQLIIFHHLFGTPNQINSQKSFFNMSFINLTWLDFFSWSHSSFCFATPKICRVTFYHFLPFYPTLVCIPKASMPMIMNLQRKGRLRGCWWWQASTSWGKGW